MGRQKQASEGRTNDLKDQIDQNLRRVYEEALEQEIPQRFKDLLEELRRKAVDK